MESAVRASSAGLPLDEATAIRLVSLARALKAAVRAVALYPPEHPAIGASFARLVETSTLATDEGPFTVTVAPHALTIDGRSLVRPDPAAAELAGILHQHLIGLLTIEPGADEEIWRTFLELITSPPDHLRAQGGIARVWVTSGGHHLSISELDYGEILREKKSGPEATWDRIIANGLKRDVMTLDEDTLRELVEMAADPDRLAEMSRRVEAQVTRASDVRAHATVLLRVFKRIVEHITENDPQRLPLVLDNIAGALCRLSDDFVSALVVPHGDPNRQSEGSELVSQIAGRMQPEMIAQLAARSIAAHRGATARLAEVLRTLVPEAERRQAVLTLTREALAHHPIANTPGFEELWGRVSALLAGHSDEAYVSPSYDLELDTVRAQATAIGRIAGDPPERVALWLRTVSDAALRGLDVQLLIDIIRIETDPQRWRDMTRLVITYIDDLVLIGDFRSARQLVETLRGQQATPQDPYRVSWVIGAIDTLVAGQMVGHLGAHLQTIMPEEVAEVMRLGRAVGTSLVAPLAEAIAVEERPRVRQRLTEMLLAHGAEGRASVAQLMQSANPGVRRTAVQLLRQFGGNEALPELTALLDDGETPVRHEALRAILAVGTDEAYAVLERALTSGAQRVRDAIMDELTTLRDSRGAPLFCYILRHTDHRGATSALYRIAIARLGSLGGPQAIEALTSVLYRGEWWVPGRTARLRQAAARALAKIGSPEARDALREAAASGARGVRAAARKAAV